CGNTKYPSVSTAVEIMRGTLWVEKCMACFLKKSGLRKTANRISRLRAAGVRCSFCMYNPLARTMGNGSGLKSWADRAGEGWAFQGVRELVAVWVGSAREAWVSAISAGSVSTPNGGR